MTKWAKGSTPIQGECWFSGIYKVVLYRDCDAGYRVGNTDGECFFAYYKPAGQKNWGDRVNKDMPQYKTLKLAKKACALHAELTTISGEQNGGRERG